MTGVTPFPQRMTGARLLILQLGHATWSAAGAQEQSKGSQVMHLRARFGIHENLEKRPVMYARAWLGYMARRKKGQSCMREPVWGT
jgi:hypothetical protein